MAWYGTAAFSKGLRFRRGSIRPRPFQLQKGSVLASSSAARRCGGVLGAVTDPGGEAEQGAGPSGPLCSPGPVRPNSGEQGVSEPGWSSCRPDLVLRMKIGRSVWGVGGELLERHWRARGLDVT